MNSLKKQALHGAFWSFAERFGQQGVQFVISIILARLLEPKDFGVLGMIMIFTVLAQSVVDSGFGTALIQKQDADHTDESTVFWFNILGGVAMAGVLFAAAPWIAAFYEVPLLVPITRVFSLNLVINSFGIVQNALLVKQLLFKRRMLPIMAGGIVSGAVGIWMAMRGFGVWSLVAQGLVQNTVQTAGLWVIHPWRPRLTFSASSFRVLWKFGSNLLFAGMLSTVFDNLYMLIIGKIYSATDLGFYSRAMRLTQMTSNSISMVIHQVNLPLMSKVQNDPERLRRIFTKVLQSSMLVILPMMAGLAVAAPSFIHILLGAQWMPCVPYLQIICLIGINYPLHLLNLGILAAIGRSDVRLRVEIAKRLITVISVFCTYRFGIQVMLWGGVVSSCLGLICNSFYVHRFVEYGLLRQLYAIRHIALASALMASVAWGTGQWVHGAPWLVLAVQVTAGSLAFLVAAWSLRDPMFHEGLAYVMGKIRRKGQHGSAR